MGEGRVCSCWGGLGVLRRYTHEMHGWGERHDVVASAVYHDAAAFWLFVGAEVGLRALRGGAILEFTIRMTSTASMRDLARKWARSRAARRPATLQI